MSEILGEQVIVENASGAAGIIGVNRVVNNYCPMEGRSPLSPKSNYFDDHHLQQY
jgi:hypothetical protein